MFDLDALRCAVEARARVARVVIASVDGSSPREAGAAMLVWADGSEGTIGGGALEWEATRRAQMVLATGGGTRIDREALGPKLGQCCGGAVTLLTEVYDAKGIAELDGQDVIARPVDGRDMPLAVRRILGRARGEGVIPAPTLVQGWMVEPVARPSRHIWVWGAGHVGRALVSVLAPLPELAITWVDVAAERFPDVVPDAVTMLPATDPAALVTHAPATAEHVILTYSHALDLELCHRLLGRGFVGLGLIGSQTKWARFRSRLTALGHSPAQIARINCPIGDPSLGKHPQAIALGVATELLKARTRNASRQENAG
jgi:xanthine dehydrogenase accessory factor